MFQNVMLINLKVYETEISSIKKGEYMFENIRNNLDELERIVTKAHEEELTNNEKEFWDYFEMTLAKSMIKELWSADKVAKIILAHKDMLGDIKIKIQ